MNHAFVACDQGCKGLVVTVLALSDPILFIFQLAHAAVLIDRTTGAEQSFAVFRLLFGLQR